MRRNMCKYILLWQNIIGSVYVFTETSPQNEEREKRRGIYKNMLYSSHNFTYTAIAIE